ncbi:hypothetical protein CBL_01354 [Carabus blaptoides fortunei]
MPTCINPHIPLLNAQRYAGQQVQRKISTMANPVFSIIWLLIFIFISFIVAGFCAFWYIVIFPFTVCLPDLSKLTDLLLAGVQFPHYCAQGLMEGKGFS